MIFFSDRDLGSKIFPTILRQSGIQLEIHDDHFGPETWDEEWITEAGQRGWYCVSRNKDIRYKKNEIKAVMSAGVGLFILVGPMATHEELAKNFVRTIAGIQRFTERHERPFIAKVRRPANPRSQGSSELRSGRVELWTDYEQWRSGLPK